MDEKQSSRRSLGPLSSLQENTLSSIFRQLNSFAYYGETLKSSVMDFELSFFKMGNEASKTVLPTLEGINFDPSTVVSKIPLGGMLI